MKNSNKIQLCALFALLTGAHLALIWLLPYFPSQDGPSHLYNLNILKDLNQGGALWGNFFTANLSPTPNLGFLIITYPLSFYLPLLIIEKIFLSLYILLMVSAGLYLFTTFNRDPWPFVLLLFPVLFNYSLLMGFYSYSIAVPIFLICLCLCWRSRNFPFTYKCIINNIAGYLIYFCHIIPFIFFLIGLLLIPAITTGNIQNKIKKIFFVIISILPILTTLFFFLNQTGNQLAQDPSYILDPHRLGILIVKLLQFSTVIFSPLELISSSIFSFFVILGVYTFTKKIILQSNLIYVTNEPRIFLGYLAIILTLIYLVAPTSFAGGSYFNSRIPWVIVMLALPLLELPATTFWNRHTSALIVGVVSISFAFSALTFNQQNKKVSLFTEGLQSAMQMHSFIMTYKTAPPGWGGVDPLLHASSYYGIIKQAVDTGNYEASAPHFFTRFRNDLPHLPSIYQIACHPESIDLSAYSAISYILGWQIDNNSQTRLSKYFKLVWNNQDMTIWERKPPRS